MRWGMVILALVVCTVQVAVQEKADVPPPVLTEVEQLRVRLVVLTDQLSSCQQSLNKNNVISLSGQVRSSIEATYPGWTVNWETGTLVAKPQSPSNKKEK